MPFSGWSQRARRSHFCCTASPITPTIRDTEEKASTYGWHGSLALKPSPHSIVDTLRLPPARVYTFEPVALMPVEVLGAYVARVSASSVIQGLTANGSHCGDSIGHCSREVDARFLTILMCFFAGAICQEKISGMFVSSAMESESRIKRFTLWCLIGESLTRNL